MSQTENQDQRVTEIGEKVRAVASQIPFEQRADLIREVIFEVRNALKNEPSIGGAPEGRDWEMDRLARLAQAAEEYYDETLTAKRSRGQ
jgi:hypothetical protein